MTYYGHIGASIGSTHLGHIPTFAWDKVLLEYIIIILPHTLMVLKNAGPQVTHHSCFRGIII